MPKGKQTKDKNKGDNKVKHEVVLTSTEDRIHQLTSLVIEITERNELYQNRIDNMKEDEITSSKTYMMQLIRNNKLRIKMYTEELSKLEEDRNKLLDLKGQFNRINKIIEEKKKKEVVVEDTKEEEEDEDLKLIRIKMEEENYVKGNNWKIVNYFSEECFKDELDQVRALLLDDSKNEVLGFLSILTDEEANKMLEDIEQD